MNGPGPRTRLDGLAARIPRSGVGPERDDPYLRDARRFALIFIVLLATSEYTFRQRDAGLALEGSIDLQVLVQLAIWVSVGAWVLRYAARLGQVFTFTDLGPSGRAFVATAGLVLFGSFYGPVPISVVRASQFAMLAMVVMVTFRRLRGHAEAIHELWLWIRRSMFVICIVPAVLTRIVPIWTSFVFSASTGQRRYHWFTMHPIATANMLGIALVMVAGAYMVSRDRWFVGRREYLVLAPIGGLFAILLLWTKGRGTIGATAVAMSVILLMAPIKRRRGLVMLGLWTVVVGLGVGLAGTQLNNVAFRGQTTEEVLSLTGRTSLFELAIELFLERPIHGYGYLAGRYIYLDRFEWAGESHNVYLEIAVSLGVLGLAAFGFLIARTVVTLRRAARDRANPIAPLVPEALALMVMTLVNGFTGQSFGGQPNSQTLAFVFAILIADLAWSMSPQSSQYEHHRVNRGRHRGGLAAGRVVPAHLRRHSTTDVTDAAEPWPQRSLRVVPPPTHRSP